MPINTIYRKSSKNLLFVVLATLMMTVSCDDPGQAEKKTKPSPKKGQLKDGLIVRKHANGNTSTEVNYKAGRKHGTSTSYYENGNKQLVMPYKEGVREGISLKYYENGKIYAETPYEGGKINGMRKTYYTNGKIKAETPYKDNYIGTGAITYSVDGAQLPGYELQVKKTGEGTYELSTDKTCRKTIYYQGPLADDQYLDEAEVIVMPMSGSKGIYVNKYNLKSMNFIAKCITPGNSTILISKQIKAR